MNYLIQINLIVLVSLVFVFSSCDDDPVKKKSQELEATVVNDLNTVSTKNFTLFSFAEGNVVDNSDSATTQWDIGFRGTTIILNGGTSGPGTASGQVVENIFDELTTAPVDGYVMDGTSKAIAGSAWYSYTGEAPTGPKHAILPIAGKVILMKTAAGKYAKMEILSYYKGNPNTTTAEFADLVTRPESRYYTFRFMYQPDGSINFETTAE